MIRSRSPDGEDPQGGGFLEKIPVETAPGTDVHDGAGALGEAKKFLSPLAVDGMDLHLAQLGQALLPAASGHDGGIIVGDDGSHDSIS